jgi:hypothetical protein
MGKEAMVILASYINHPSQWRFPPEWIKSKPEPKIVYDYKSYNSLLKRADKFNSFNYVVNI